jgi:hypothetical protein
LRNAHQASLILCLPVQSPVSRIAIRLTRSGFSTATRRPIGPPQSWTTKVASRRSRSSTSVAAVATWRSYEYQSRSMGLSDRPNPMRSGATQRKPASRTGGITFRQR